MRKTRLIPLCTGLEKKYSTTVSQSSLFSRSIFRNFSFFFHSVRRIRRPSWERSDGGTKDKKTFLALPFFPHRSLLLLLRHTVVATIVSSLFLSLLFPFRGRGGKAFYAPLLLFFHTFSRLQREWRRRRRISCLRLVAGKVTTRRDRLRSCSFFCRIFMARERGVERALLLFRNSDRKSHGSKGEGGTFSFFFLCQAVLSFFSICLQESTRGGGPLS